MGGFDRKRPYERAVVYCNDWQSTGHDSLVFLSKSSVKQKFIIVFIIYPSFNIFLSFGTRR